jgi:predicted nuclease of predicted toxin-antitoxin system
MDIQIRGKGKYALKLLLDEMYAGLKEYFETLGWEVLAAQDVGLKSAKDKDIVEYAQEHDFLLVTQDQKPAELAELKGAKHVLISNVMIAKIADQEIRRKYPNVENE